MIDHIGVGVSDYAAARRFYDAALATLGIVPMIEVTAEESGGDRHVGYGRDGKAFFWLSAGGARGAGMHVAFTAPDRQTVHAFYEAALAHGGRDNGAPGLRPQYHPDYYGAFVFDPDGTNVEAVCHAPA